MQLIYSTWPEVEEYLKTSKGIIIPIGATEQHGPIGCIGTDAICAEGIAIGVGKETNTLVAPTITVGMSIHHTAFPGSMTLKPSTLLQVLMDYFTSLARHGFEQFFIVNGHGGNDSSIHSAIWETYSNLSDSNMPHAARIRFMATDWWKPKAVREKCHELVGDKEGYHATPGEIAVTMHVSEECRKRAGGEFTPIAPPDSSDYGPADFRRSYPDGTIKSDPSLATPELGKQLYDVAVAAIGERYKKFVAAN